MPESATRAGKTHEARQVLRGFVTGGAWGLIVAALGVTTASLLAPQPPGNASPGAPLVVMAQVAAAPVLAELAAPQAGVSNLAPDAAVEPAATGRAMLDQPVANLETTTEIADTTPASPPVIATADAGLTAPVESGTPALTPALTPAADSPVLPSPQAPAPVIPLSEADLMLSTDPAPPPVAVPVTPAVAPPVVPATEPAPQDPIAVIPVLPEAAAPPVVVAEAAVAPDVSPAPDTIDPVPLPDPVTLPTADPQTGVEPDSGAAPVLTPGLTPAPEIAAAPQVLPQVLPQIDPANADVPGRDSVPEPLPEALPEPLPEALAESAPPPVSEPDQPPAVVTLAPDLAQTAPPPARIVLQGDAGNLPQVAGGVRVNRPETSTPIITDAAVALADTSVADAPALVEFAGPFSNPDGKPMLSIILIDDGAIVGLADALGDVPFPVTIAIDPGNPDALGRMAAYRDRGIEVLAIARLPQGAQPSDVEVTLEAVFAEMPQAVGLIDLGDGQVQSSAAVIGQTRARLAADGRGLVLFSDGLNPALRAATTAGVPAVEVARDLDSNGQDAGTIRRFLDNAAFQARQESGIVLLARLRPATISALILWGAENRAGQMALAPISAILGQ